MRLPWSVTKGASPGPGRERDRAVTSGLGGNRLDQPHRRHQSEAHHLDRQREQAERRDQLALVGDHHHPVRRRGHDLLAQQRAAAALDHAQLIVDLVGAVDRQIELRRLVERGQRDAELLGLHPRGLRGRDADHVQALRHLLAQRRDEAGRRRSGAKAKPHPVGDEIERGAGGAFLELVRLEQAPPPLGSALQAAHHLHAPLSTPPLARPQGACERERHVQGRHHRVRPRRHPGRYRAGPDQRAERRAHQARPCARCRRRRSAPASATAPAS